MSIAVKNTMKERLPPPQKFYNTATCFLQSACRRCLSSPDGQLIQLEPKASLWKPFDCRVQGACPLPPCAQHACPARAPLQNCRRPALRPCTEVRLHVLGKTNEVFLLSFLRSKSGGLLENVFVVSLIFCAKNHHQQARGQMRANMPNRVINSFLGKTGLRTATALEIRVALRLGIKGATTGFG